MDEANRKERLEALNERSSRHTDTTDGGPEAGYHRLYRRPRTSMTTECMPVARADRVEGFAREMHEMMEFYEDD